MSGGFYLQTGTNIAYIENLIISNLQFMKILTGLILILLFKFSFSQSQVEYKRIWTDYSDLTLIADSTFTEKHYNFSCGTYSNSLGGTDFYGTWTVNQGTLTLKYNGEVEVVMLDTLFLIDTLGERLVSINKNGGNYNFYKTKECFDNLNKCRNIDPKELIQQFESLSVKASRSELAVLSDKIKFWNRLLGYGYLYNGNEFLEDIPYENHKYFETAFMMGKFDYLFKYPSTPDSLNRSDQLQYGLKYAMELYNTNRSILPEIKLFHKISRLEKKGRLDDWIVKKIKDKYK